MRVDDNLTQPWDKNEFWENKIIKDYNDIIEIVCKSRQISFIPLFNLINETELSDGLHPNAKAHEKIFNHIKGYLLNYF